MQSPKRCCCFAGLRWHVGSVLVCCSCSTSPGRTHQGSCW
jgi:hypothetical protein